MKISELIILLEKAKEEFGDLEMRYMDNEYGEQSINELHFSDDYGLMIQ